jgi:hypothetical protein
MQTQKMSYIKKDETTLDLLTLTDTRVKAFSNKASNSLRNSTKLVVTDTAVYKSNLLPSIQKILATINEKQRP